MGTQARWVRYGRHAVEALRAEIAAAKGDEPLAPVTVVVPSNQVGVSARRLLASGTIGSVCGRGVGLAAVTFLTTYRLAELLGAATLAGTGRRPISTPVLTAAVRASLQEGPGLFASVATHPATEAALVAAYRELRDVSPAALEAIATHGARAADVVRLHRRTRARLEPDWYDEEDLMTAATAAVGARAAAGALGAVIVYLPQRLSRHAAVLVEAVAGRSECVVLAGSTGDGSADAEVVASLARLGVDGGEPAHAGPVVAVSRTRLFTASDADDEVREAVRAVVDAARQGTPLDRIAILYASPEPYDRLVREQLAAAGIAANGTTQIPIAARMAGRTLLQLIELPALGFRRQDVFSWLSAAPVRHEGRWAPVTAWERLSREAGVVGGRRDWDRLLADRADRLETKAAAAEADPDRPERVSEQLGRDADRTRQLRTFVLDLIDGLAGAASNAEPWGVRARWARELLGRILGDGGRRDRWPAVERQAAERVDLALDRLGALDALEAAVDLDVFTRTLAVELESDLGRVGRFGEGVLVGSVSMGVGLDLDLVILLGLAEGSFPAPVHEDSLLPDHEREAANGELPLRSERIARQHREFLAALAAADHHLLGVPRGDLRRSSERVPSRWALEVASSLAGERWWSGDLLDAKVTWIDHVASFDAGLRRLSFPATAQEHRLRTFLAADGSGDELVALAEPADPASARAMGVLHARRSARFTRFDGNLAGLRIPSPVETRTSATSLERWAKCPQAYLVHNLLGVQEQENPEEDLQISALDKGSLVHEALEVFVMEILRRPPDEQPVPDQTWTPEDHELLRTIGAQVCDRYEARGLTGRPIFWRRDRARIIADLLRFLAHDEAYRRATGSRLLAAELAFGWPGGLEPVALPLPDGRSLPLRGKADRVDVSDDGTIRVLDYKTGGANSYKKLSEEDPDQCGTRLQLAIYGQAARLHQKRPEAAVEAKYWFVSNAQGFKQFGYRLTPDVLEHVTATIATIVSGIEAGIFVARPSLKEAYTHVDCVFCDPDGLGTTELRRQWERKVRDVGLLPYVALAEPTTVDELDELDELGQATR